MEVIKRNPEILDYMKQTWNKFLIERISNKIMVDSIIKGEYEQKKEKN
jgi:hypothetical protein